MDRPGFENALRIANSQVAATNGEEVMVSCAQDILKVRVLVTVTSHVSGHPRSSNISSVGLRFVLPFPSARLHVGDAFGNALLIDLPAVGSYSVDIHHRGREEAELKLRELNERLVAMSAVDDMAHLEQLAGIEQYEIRLAMR
ncbi:hypothetical protein [Micromonospora sp. LOL_023]|uniref:hypothetical protein n=1 Tax=Micromonospora sp. LOL_023 TaxID=3345418 RepID=UPI003A8939FA